MICSARELGLGEDHDGHHRAARRTPGRPGDDARPVLGLDEEVIEFEINPDRAYALSLRGVAREAALGFDAPYTDPALREVPAAERRRLPGARRGPRRLPGLRGPHGHRLRPDRADAGLARAPASGWPACGRSRWRSTSPTT